MSFYYLASPYSKYHAGTDEAHRIACVNTALLIRNRIPVFSPIAHSHPIALHGSIPLADHDIWLPADKPMIDVAMGCIVLKMQGWDESFGVKWEIEEFQKAGKPVYYMDEGMVPLELWNGVV